MGHATIRAVMRIDDAAGRYGRGTDQISSDAASSAPMAIVATEAGNERTK
jgi:hypothetical protein